MTATPSIPPREAAGFLSLPYELRLEIYQYLLVDDDADGTYLTRDLTSAVKMMSSPPHAPYPSHPFPYWSFTAFGAPIPKHEQRPPGLPKNTNNTNNNKPNKNGAAILRTCHQIHEETLPILYSRNQFLASENLLTRWPRLRTSLPPVQQAESNPQIRSLLTRFRLHLRLDIPPRFTAEAAAREFSGKQELVIDASQAAWRGAGPDHLRHFEGVRGVKKARIVGSTGGFEGYVRWLEQSMMAPMGSVVKPFRGVLERGFDVTYDSDSDGDGESVASTDPSDVFSSAGSQGSSLSSSPSEASPLGLVTGFRKL